MFWVGFIGRIINFILGKVRPQQVFTFEQLVQEVRYGNILYMWDSVGDSDVYTHFRLIRPGLRDVVLTLPRKEARTPQNLIKLRQVRDILKQEIRHMAPPQKQGAWWR